MQIVLLEIELERVVLDDPEHLDAVSVVGALPASLARTQLHPLQVLDRPTHVQALDRVPLVNQRDLETKILRILAQQLHAEVELCSSTR